ncbi:MAG: class I SAM-dependent methyltransferase [Candidatus Woesearchaeota archaeon]
MEYYETISEGYDELYGEEQVEKARMVLRYINPKGRLLDVGAGTGVATRLFERYCECVALDPSEKLLERYDGKKIASKAENIPFPKDCFDVVISLTALHHSDLKKALEEIFRVVKPNGQIAISMLKKAEFDISLFKDFKKIDGGKDWIFVKNV